MQNNYVGYNQKSVYAVNGNKGLDSLLNVTHEYHCLHTAPFVYQTD